VQLRDQLLLVFGARMPRLKQIGQPVANGRFPLRDLRRMNRVLSRQLRDRLKPHQGFESYLGLEGRTVPFSFCFHQSAFSHFQQTNKSLSSSPVV
jgi:hypothetical protein